jgi:hypothetical protein
MERHAGLGRSLGDVLDSMTPAEPEPMTEATRALFEPEAVEERLESLMADVAVLRRRVRRLERLVPKDSPDALAEPEGAGVDASAGVEPRNAERRTDATAQVKEAKKAKKPKDEKARGSQTGGKRKR